MQANEILFFSIAVITFIFKKVKDDAKNKKECIAVVTIILTCFSGFRSWWMGDLIKYYTLYKNVNSPVPDVNYMKERNVNNGIRYFFKIAGYFGISYDICIFIIAAFSAVTLGIIIYKYSPSLYLSYLMYISIGFYTFTFSGLKQTIAMGFIILAVMQIFKNNFWRFLFWVIIAGFFHAPAFIMLPAYFFAKRRIDLTYVLFLIAILALGYIFRDDIVEWLNTAYYEGEHMYNENKAIGGRMIGMIGIIILGVAMRPVRYEDSIYSQVFHLMIIAAIIQYFSVYNNVFTRLADYYYQFVVLFVPLILESGEHQMLKNANLNYKVKMYGREIYRLLGIGVTAFAIWFYYTSTLNGDYLDSFKFFWELDPYSLYGK